MELTELDRLERVEREAEALTMAERMAMAFHEPKRLQQERQAFLARSGLEKPRDEALTAAERIDARLRQGGIYRH